MALCETAYCDNNFEHGNSGPNAAIDANKPRKSEPLIGPSRPHATAGRIAGHGRAINKPRRAILLVKMPLSSVLGCGGVDAAGLRSKFRASLLVVFQRAEALSVRTGTSDLLAIRLLGVTWARANIRGDHLVRQPQGFRNAADRLDSRKLVSACDRRLIFAHPATAPQSQSDLRQFRRWARKLVPDAKGTTI